MNHATAVERLRFVKGAQRVGLRLREIRELLEVLDRGQCPCGHTDALLRRRLVEVEVELVRLGGLRAELTRLLAQAPEQGCSAATADQWWCVQAFAQEGGDGDGGVPELRLPVR
jgi:DNA-binding transcriptional MerR regulator